MEVLLALGEMILVGFFFCDVGFNGSGMAIRVFGSWIRVLGVSGIGIEVLFSGVSAVSKAALSCGLAGACLHSAAQPSLRQVMLWRPQLSQGSFSNRDPRALG